jgi:hypothetical protein
MRGISTDRAEWLAPASWPIRAPRWIALLLTAALLTGCAAATRQVLNLRYGRPDPTRPPPAQVAASVPDYRHDAKRVLDSRCVVCHGCYDAPCQLSLASYDGLRRGANPSQVYANRLLATAPTRIHVDAQTTAEWREKGFHPVLNERASTAEANREASVIYRLLRLKRTQPPPENAVLPNAKYDFSLDRKQVCSAVEDVAGLEKDHPQWGMPFGLPALSDADYLALTRWIEAGAPYRPAPDLSPRHIERVARWEAFLNGDANKSRLMARYVYEHWFLGHLHFDDLPPGEFFDLVRSKTPPGQPLQLIATRRPFDDPGVERVYYRLRRVQDTLLVKTHMPYALNPARMAKMKTLFLDPDYAVETLPSYAPDVASNPFRAFQALPVNARYRFMLDEAQFTVMGFIKGPVCRGQVALSVINDHYWTVFLSPDSLSGDSTADFLERELHHLSLPAEQGSIALPLSNWKKYSELQTRYLRAKSEESVARFDGRQQLTLDAVWAGEGEGGNANANAALTIFRHGDSASVVKGLIGPAPQTVWVLGYPLLERIHYLLVAGYDVHGNVGHQLVTRLYMDFLRMEAEMNYLALLPSAARDAVRDHWYRGASDDVKAYLLGSKAWFAAETGIAFKDEEPNMELQQLLRQRLAPVLDRRYDIAENKLTPALRAQLARLAGLRGGALKILPEVAFVTLRGGGGKDHHYTLLHNRSFSNITHLFGEAERRLPDEDSVTLVEGFLGAYPEAFFVVSEAQLPDFVDTVAALKTEDDYQAKLMARYAIRRTDARFWPHSDELHAVFRAQAGVEAGLFDYNRFENR